MTVVEPIKAPTGQIVGSRSVIHAQVFEQHHTLGDLFAWVTRHNGYNLELKFETEVFDVPPVN